MPASLALRWPNVLLLACLSKASEDNAPPLALIRPSVNAFKPSNTVEHFPRPAGTTRRERVSEWRMDLRYWRFSVCFCRRRRRRQSGEGRTNVRWKRIDRLCCSLRASTRRAKRWIVIGSESESPACRDSIPSTFHWRILVSNVVESPLSQWVSGGHFQLGYPRNRTFLPANPQFPHSFPPLRVLRSSLAPHCKAEIFAKGLRYFTTRPSLNSDLGSTDATTRRWRRRMGRS